MKYICGIDENGFGPVMGPLVVTATVLSSGIKSSVFPEVKDSKLFFTSGIKRSYEKIEEFAITVYFILTSKLPSSPLNIMDRFCLPVKCEKKENICFGNISQKFLWSKPDKAIEKYRNFIEIMKFKIEDLTCSVICPYEFNRMIEKGNSKFVINLAEFCNLIKKYDESAEIFAGKIGGLKYYLKYLKYFFPDFRIFKIIESEKNSIYILKKGKQNLKLGFYLDVEKISFPAAISSIVGKYIREIFMESIRRRIGIDEKISGYRDIKTKKVIKKIKFDRIEKECVIRKK